MKIAIIGGSGRLGLWYAARLQALGNQVTITGRNKTKLEKAASIARVEYTCENEAAIKQADIIILSTPIETTPMMVQMATRAAKPGALICDFASVKTAVAAAFQTVTREDIELVSLHPLHGPRIENLQGVTILTEMFRAGPVFAKLRALLVNEGAHMITVDARTQDEAMAILQGLTHFVALAAASTLKGLTVPEFTTPAYTLMRTFLARIILQDPVLYAAIQLENPKNNEVRQAFLTAAQRLCQLAKQGNLKELQNEIESSASIFSDSETELNNTDICLSAISRFRPQQNIERIATLGPPGTFSDVAVRQYEQMRGKMLAPVYCRTIADVFDAVKKNEVKLGIVPVENLIDGTIVVSLDCLFDTGLRISAELLVPIHHSICAALGTTVESITRVFSIAPVMGQVRNWLRENVPQAKLVETNSTAEAIMQVADGRIEGDAAIGLAATAEAAGLSVLARDIEDEKNNVTRFLVIALNDASPTENDRTSICIHNVANKPGILDHILQVLARHSINLSKIESRPTRRQLGEYRFYIDVEGHRQCQPLAKAIKELEQECQVAILGSYPRAF
ncbi:MAG: prephenate dehydratase [Deltaproteobacteria bacterium]|nr:prephenate dehydratase [Deltaproteobacteria bacterium]